MTDAELVIGDNKQIEIPLVKASPIVGKLSDNVPRPVRNGRVELVSELQVHGEKKSVPIILSGRVELVALQSANAHDRRVQWHTWVPVQEDGSFTINAWPTGEAFRALAICDGFHRNADNVPNDLVDLINDESPPIIQTHVFREGEPVEMKMVPLANGTVTVLDEYQNPVANVEVKAWPWADYAGSYARSELYLHGRDDQDLYPHPFHQRSDVLGTLTMQLPAGKSVFTVANDVYELPITLRVDAKWG